MNWFLTAVLCALLVEFAVRLPFADVIAGVSRSGKKAIRVVRAKAISDHWKEKALGAYARTTFISSIKLAGLLVVLLGIATAVVAAFDQVSGGFQSFILGWLGIAFSVVFASLYFVARKSVVHGRSDGSDYSMLDRFLHRLALQVVPIAELSFDMDQRTVHSDPGDIVGERHVFVSGLARAGTTVLMRRFHDTGAYRSLTYRDMPFVLAPNLWRKLSRSSKQDVAASERAHGDRILVDVESPESLDEVFWRIFVGEEYIEKTHLQPHSPDQETTGKFVRYVNAILNAQDFSGTRYLSKNNNNILRLQGIRRAFPQALILIPFRDPLSHAGSLLRQHRKFTETQKTDRFVTSYMTWLVHHEFGLDHRPFRFDEAGHPHEPSYGTDTSEYWLELWCATHEWLEHSAPEDAIFVCYEDLCGGAGVWDRLATISGIPSCREDMDAFSLSKASAEASDNATLTKRASSIYARLADRSRAALREPA